MAFIFTCGTHTFTKQVAGYENVNARCQNCGNFSARVVSRWEWFTFCFVPLIPFSVRPWHEVLCHICNFGQDLKYRQDITSGHAESGPGPGLGGQAQGRGNGGGGGGQQQIPMQNYGQQQQQVQMQYPSQGQGKLPQYR